MTKTKRPAFVLETAERFRLNATRAENIGGLIGGDNVLKSRLSALSLNEAETFLPAFCKEVIMNKGTHLLLSLTVGMAASHVQLPITSAHPPVEFSLGHAAFTIQGRNTISGHVFGPSREPVSDVNVELLNDVYSTIDRTKTSGAGRYLFSNLPQGNYKVRVLPFNTDYAEQSQDVTIYNISIIPGGGADNVQLDFYLKLRSDASAKPFAAPPGTIFVQEVPAAAKKLYEKGVNELRDKKEKEGFASLKGSLEIFPDYYLALERLGTEYVVRGYHEAARILLTKAVEINPRGYPSVIGLGIAQYQLKQTGEAIENLRRATTLHNKSADAHLWLGIALKRARKLNEAEAAMKRAKEINKDKAADVHWHMALLYSDQGRYKEAADELELFLKYQPNARDAEKIKQLIKQLREKAAKQ